ncbi:MAG: UTP--glucose-1-phosphate uridylyltransferase GalU [Francisellaceae bacterium]|jgi:UTP--glucose-1-phosphate uridylyltransferase|nr:UTP--glucose-1-phosphate uridylyltransferase GalU [Francisellaceae bacterium]MBT6207456.1 UTP--glucose-1-phosphate uridylyltransferase GalU [Francisellaceae bacterium]MBT6539879.1 UTP--glucose-1-phosphate uridylyltransferase GalU [Francisellaceae bacterium]
MQINKAVFPVAGLGTRFLPATKASPKEMLPIIDKPIIQYAVEEVLELGIKTLIFITSNDKRAIEDHFDRNYQLEKHLEETNKLELLALVKSIIPNDVSCIYLRQYRMLGLGHAILCAKPVLGNEPFIVSLADDLIYNNNKSCLAQMLDIYNDTGSSVLAAQNVPKSECHKYGIIAQEPIKNNLGKISRIIEKPSIDQAPSTLASVGRYIFTNKIINNLQTYSEGHKSEIHITPAIDMLAAQENVLAYEFTGTRYDCGDKLGYLKAVYDYGIRHPILGEQFKDFVTNKTKTN